MKAIGTSASLNFIVLRYRKLCTFHYLNPVRKTVCNILGEKFYLVDTD